MKEWSLILASGRDQGSMLDLYHEDAVLFPNGAEVKGFLQIVNYLTVKFPNTKMDFIPHFKEMTSDRGYEYGIIEMVEIGAGGPIDKGRYSIVWIHSDVNSWKIISHILDHQKN